MRTLVLYIFSLALLGVQSCATIDEMTRFSRTFTGFMEFTPENMSAMEGSVTSDLLEVDIEDVLESQDAKKKKLEKIRMEEFFFEIFPIDSNENFDFLESMEFFIEAEGAEPLKIGQVSDMPDGKQGVNVGITFAWDHDITPYIENGGFKIRVEYKRDKDIPHPMSLRFSNKTQFDIRRFFI